MPDRAEIGNLENDAEAQRTSYCLRVSEHTFYY